MVYSDPSLGISDRGELANGVLCASAPSQSETDLRPESLCISILKLNHRVDCCLPIVSIGGYYIPSDESMLEYIPNLLYKTSTIVALYICNLSIHPLRKV